MGKETLYNFSVTSPVQITRELYANVGSGINQLGDVKRAFLGSADFEIWDSAVGGTQLTEGVDYQITPQDTFYSNNNDFGLSTIDVYAGYQILNPTYQTGNIYITYKILFSYTDADYLNNLNVQYARIDLLEKRLPAGIVLANMLNDDPVTLGYRILPLIGSVIDATDAEYLDLVTNTYCGDANNATAPAFYKTSDAGGTTRDTAGAYLVLPDTRGLSLKNIGDATISGRTKVGPVELGEVQEDQIQKITGSVPVVLTQAGADPVGTGTGALDFLTSVGLQAAGGGAYYQNPMTFDSSNSPNVRSSSVTDGATRDSTMGTNFGITY